MPLDRLPPSLQQLVLLEWLSPTAVCRVARAGSSRLRCAVLTSPCAFRAANREVLSDACVRWFSLPLFSSSSSWRSSCSRPSPLVLWTTEEMDCKDRIRLRKCNGKLHSDDDEPAILWDDDGSKTWYKHGILHRDNDLPAKITMQLGSVFCCHKWYQNGELHRDGDKPAVICFIKRTDYIVDSQCWYQRGQRHRDGDLPAVIHRYGTQEWYQHNKLHRDNDQPAVIHRDGTQFWYKNGERHRDNDDQPAEIWWDGRQKWYKNGKLHRDGDKPAVIQRDGTQEWHQNGVFLRERNGR